jgi:hypothetical protein
MAPTGKGKWLSRGFANFLFADHPPRTGLTRPVTVCIYGAYLQAFILKVLPLELGLGHSAIALKIPIRPEPDNGGYDSFAGLAPGSRLISRSIWPA